MTTHIPSLARHSKRRDRIAIFIGLVLAGLCLLQSLTGILDAAIHRQTGTIVIGCEKPGVTLLVLDYKLPIIDNLKSSGRYENKKILVVDHQVVGSRKLVQYISDLRGFVRIESLAEALRYVRVQTSPYLNGLWDAGDVNKAAFEIVDRANLEQALHFGYVTQYAALANDEIENSKQPSGFYGVLSSKDFKTYGFTQPQVRQVESAFEIKRWLIQFRTRHTVTGKYRNFHLDNDYVPDEVQFVKEIVTKDGDYRRTIVKVVKGERVPMSPDLFFTGIFAGNPTICN